MKDSSKTNQDLIAENSALKKKTQELEQTLSERIREENERRARQLTVLHETSVELTVELNLDALLHSIAQRALNLIGGAACNCYLYNPQTDLLERVATAGTAMVPSPKTRHRGEGMVGQVWVKETPLLLNDYASWPGRTRAYDSFPSRALVAVPFRLGTEILGVLNIMAPLPHQYTQMDVEMLSLFATQAAIAIRNVRIHDRMKMELADRKRAEEALESERTLLRNLIDNVPDRIYAKDSEGRFIICNEAMIRRMGMTSMAELVGKSDFDFLPPEMAQRFRTDEQAIIQSGKSMINREEPLATEGGTITRWNLATKVPLLDNQGNRIGIVGVGREITDRKQMEEALRDSEKRYRELSIVDDLTQLYNSRHFYFQLKIELDRSNRYEQPLTLLLIDLDNFKTFNDAYGHVEGDHILLRFGQVTKRCLRETDFAYRYGGEEFTILLPMTTGRDCIVTAERIRTEFKKETFSPAPGQDVHVTVSIGLAQYKPQEDMKAFVHRVDQLMYTAKKNGKDRVCCES